MDRHTPTSYETHLLCFWQSLALRGTWSPFLPPRQMLQALGWARLSPFSLHPPAHQHCFKWEVEALQLLQPGAAGALGLSPYEEQIWTCTSPCQGRKSAQGPQDIWRRYLTPKLVNKKAVPLSSSASPIFKDEQSVLVSFLRKCFHLPPRREDPSLWLPRGQEPPAGSDMLLSSAKHKKLPHTPQLNQQLTPFSGQQQRCFICPSQILTLITYWLQTLSSHTLWVRGWVTLKQLSLWLNPVLSFVVV